MLQNLDIACARAVDQSVVYLLVIGSRSGELVADSRSSRFVFALWLLLISYLLCLLQREAVK